MSGHGQYCGGAGNCAARAPPVIFGMELLGVLLHALCGHIIAGAGPKRQVPPPLLGEQSGLVGVQSV